MTDRLAPVTLEGAHVRLEPLSLDHVEALAEIALEPSLWAHTPRAPLRTRADVAAYVEEALAAQASGNALPFATVHRASGRVAGCTRYGNASLPNRRVEIGWTWVGVPWQRTAVNTEAKRLMLAHAFEALGLHRVELKTDVLNARSRAAMLRIGAREEGVLRGHTRRADGSFRDTVYYSILAGEWPEVRAALDARLARGAARGAAQG